MLVVFLLAIGAWFAYKIAGVAYEKYTLKLQVNAMQAEMQRLERDNEEIKTLVAYLGNREFLKLKTKEGLNMREEDEKVAIISNNQSYAPEDAVKAEALARPVYWKKWRDMFLGLR